MNETSTSSYSPKEVATAIGVSESSLKRWVDKGIIRAEKTDGGHRRIEVDAVLQFVRDTGKGLAKPEIIGLPSELGTTPIAGGGVLGVFQSAILAGDETTARRTVLDLYLSGMSIAKICDRIISRTFHEIGEMWECSRIEVYQERRACEICQKVIHELRRAIGLNETSGIKAMGGTLDGDPYTLATSMSELVLRDCGWNAVSLGHMLPISTLIKAIELDRPRLMWVSVSTITDQERFVANMNVLFDAATVHSCAIVVGGRALNSDIRPLLRYTTYCDNFQHLESFAQSLPDITGRNNLQTQQ